MDIQRKLASIRRIDAITPIDGADKIELAHLGGWQVVVAKDQGHAAGDLVVYCEIDSWIPHAVAPFLSKGKTPREYQGIPGERLRTIRLRGQLSQGLVLPLAVLDAACVSPGGNPIPWQVGEEVSGHLDILKWEKPIPAQLQGQMRGNFPAFIPKTDQERVQNLGSDTLAANLGEWFEATVKLDGSSMTVWFKDGDWGVCSRNIDLDLEQEGNTFVDTAKRIFGGIRHPQFAALGNLAFQGELMGPGIQGNREGLNEHEFFLFDIFSIDEQRYLDPFERTVIAKRCGLLMAPPLGIMKLGGFGTSAAELLELADSQESLCHGVAEGIVFKRADGRFSFKAIANRFLELEAA